MTQYHYLQLKPNFHHSDEILLEIISFECFVKAELAFPRREMVYCSEIKGNHRSKKRLAQKKEREK